MGGGEEIRKKVGIWQLAKVVAAIPRNSSASSITAEICCILHESYFKHLITNTVFVYSVRSMYVKKSSH